MPCRSDYLEASGAEVELSKVACLLDELVGVPMNPSHWRGYHPLVYNRGTTKDQRDAMVDRLCSALQGVDVTKLSLEMQMWWRDHKAADKARLEAELREATRSNEREAALAKLTPHERALLGIKKD